MFDQVEDSEADASKVDDSEADASKVTGRVRFCEDPDIPTSEEPSPGPSSSRHWAVRGTPRSRPMASIVGSLSIVPVATHPDDFRETDNSVVDFNQIVDAEHARGGEPEGPALATVSLSAANLSARHMLKQGGALVLAMLLMSLVSFGFTAVFFGLALHLPSPRGQAPPGYGSWEECTGGADRALRVTALGRQLPYSEARAIVSIPKFFDCATMASLVGVLLAGGLTWAAGLHTVLQLTIATVASAFYLLRQSSGRYVLPTWVDPAFTVGMLCLIAVISAMSVRVRRQAQSVVTLCPKLLFALTLFLLFALNLVLLNILAVMARLEFEPALVICVSVAVLRGVGFAARQVFKSLSVPLLACFAVLFTFDISNIVALRRYVLALPSLGDAVSSAVVNALAEFSCNAVSMAYAVYIYNRCVKKGHAERASTHIHLFIMAIVSELVGEHVALHSSLGYSFFMDPRVLSVQVQEDLSLVSRAWAVSFAIEIVVDVIIVVPMVLFLPVSFTSLFGRYLQSWAAVLYFVCACVHPHLVGLHSYLDKYRFVCE